MPYEIKYKVVHQYLTHITDVDTTYGGDRDPVRLVHPLCANFNQYLDEKNADSEMFQKSLNGGRIARFIEQGHIKIVYFNVDDNKEISEEEYNKICEDKVVADKTETEKLAEYLVNKNITSEKLDKLFSLLEQKTLEESNKLKVPIIYEDFSKLNYQDKLEALKLIKDEQLLKEIQVKEKSVTFIKKATDKLNKLNSK